MKTNDKWKYMIENDKFWGFETPYAWDGIVDKALCKIADIDKDNHVQVLQIKSKFGGLRIYLNTYTDEIQAIINEAEREADHTCELCGSTELVKTLSIMGWIHTICEQCQKERKSKYDAGSRC